MINHSSIHYLSDIVFRHRLRHLNNAEAMVLKGCLANQSYQQIATSANLSEQYCHDLGYRLFQIFSKEWGEKVSKKNLTFACERHLLHFC